MEVSQIIAEIDAQITKLQQARNLLQGAGAQSSETEKPRRGRPRKDAGVATSATPKKSVGTSKRTLSPEARKRIADAQKRRWAERRKA